MEIYILNFVFIFAIFVVALISLKKIRKKAQMDWNSSYDYNEAVAKVVRNLSALGMVLILSFIIIDYNTGAFDLVYAQTNGYYVSDTQDKNDIDIINFIDHKVLEVTDNGSSSKVTYEKVDPYHFKFQTYHNGEIVEYVGEVKKENGSYQVILLGGDHSIILSKSGAINES